ncbi:winged helix family transcriptional regulator [Nocardioides sp. P86]|uniref:winged helix family transcriptional regulator n=1 Tax=Nocardioides sp. P86 TaxID=2939569 RepID=UPI00203D4E0F|nr:response regulator transcription factor [Nocardioides sp. P86]MCM3517035.1 response regulator transcription factor [Nocardioides sp. P86]
MPHILVVAGGQDRADAVAARLESADRRTATADRGSALEAVATTGPRCVVVVADGTDGAWVTPLLAELRAWSSLPVLVLADLDRDSDLDRGLDGDPDGDPDGEDDGAAPGELLAARLLDAGADDVRDLGCGDALLAAALRALERRCGGEPDPDAALTGPLLRFGPLVVDLHERSVRRDGREVRLTPTEWRLLEPLATRPGVLLTHRGLLRSAWDESHGDETRDALRAHIRSLRAKLGDDATAPTFIRTESGTGYRWIAVPSATADTRAFEQAGPGRLGARELVHELSTLLSSVRVTVYLLRGAVVAPAGAAQAPGDLLDRLEQLLARVATHAVELEGRCVRDPGVLAPAVPVGEAGGSSWR